MKRTHNPTQALLALKRLTLPELDSRLGELDAERATISSLRRSLIARDKARARTRRQLRNGGKHVE